MGSPSFELPAQGVGFIRVRGKLFPFRLSFWLFVEFFDYPTLDSLYSLQREHPQDLMTGILRVLRAPPGHKVVTSRSSTSLGLQQSQFVSRNGA